MKQPGNNHNIKKFARGEEVNFDTDCNSQLLIVHGKLTEENEQK